MANEATMTIDEGARARAFAQARRVPEISTPEAVNPAQDVVAQRAEDQARAFRDTMQTLVRQRKIMAALKTARAAGSAVPMTLGQKGSAWISYTIWATAVDNIPDTFGLSLLLLLYHDWHYATKFLGITPFHTFLCYPGQDGMLGILPPSRVPLGIIQFLYKVVNYLGLFCFNLLLLLVATGIFIQFFLPLMIMVAVIQHIVEFNVGALWDYFIALL